MKIVEQEKVIMMKESHGEINTKLEQIDSSVQLVREQTAMSQALMMFEQHERNVEICNGTEILGRDY